MDANNAIAPVPLNLLLPIPSSNMLTSGPAWLYNSDPIPEHPWLKYVIYPNYHGPLTSNTPPVPDPVEVNTITYNEGSLSLTFNTLSAGACIYQIWPDMSAGNSYDLCVNGGLQFKTDAEYLVLIGRPYCWPNTPTYIPKSTTGSSWVDIAPIPDCSGDCNYGGQCLPYPLQMIVLARRLSDNEGTLNTGWVKVNEQLCLGSAGSVSQTTATPPATNSDVRRRRQDSGTGNQNQNRTVLPQPIISINCQVCKLSGGTPVVGANKYV